jgi:predicted nucleotidyltransferase
MENNKTFELIKAEVHSILPLAKVLLFGSRANYHATDESDWDILILTKDKPDSKIKSAVHDKLFPISLKILSFINTIIVSEDDWNNNPSYYPLHQSVISKKVMA